MGIMVNESSFSNIPKAADNVVGVIYVLFGTCSLFGNSILLYISYKKRQLLKPAEYFIVNLAFSDLGMTLILYPLAITSSFSHRWIYGWHVCLFYAFCGVLFGICSLSTITLLSVVCCVKVCFPTCGNRLDRRLGCILVACAWAFAGIFAFCPLLHWGEYGVEPYGTACCIDWYSSNINKVAMSYTIALFLVCFILPCGIIITSFTLILITVKESWKAVARHGAVPARMKNVQTIIIKQSIAVFIGFFTAWSPYAVISMWVTFGSVDIIPPLAFAVPSVFAKSSTIYNPIIYLFLKPNFRNILTKSFGELRELCARPCFSLELLYTCCCTTLLQLLHKCFKKIKSICHGSMESAKGYNFDTCEQCKDTFECFKHYPKCCSTQFSTSLESKHHVYQKNNVKRSIRVIVRGQTTVEMNDLEITLEVMPGCSKCTY
ncbi:opsin-5-like [Spea bombifrons]|uniref:opsin-5-like n=1 Tax=Spea bombifrons TaxID=233779 RepID=UPI00234AFAD3|nr:opsin-5-like [Spea bombifrons]